MKEAIVLYINILAGGGAERVMAQLANGLSARGYRVILVTTYIRTNEYPIDQKVERIILEHGNTVRNGLRKNIGYIAKLRGICHDNHAGIIVSFMREPNVRALLAAIGTGTKNIISVRNDPIKEYPGPAGRFMRSFLLPMADGCVFQTEDAQKAFPERLRMKSRIILNPVAKEFFGIKRECPRHVITVCRLAPQKNIGLLIRAFARLSEKYPDEKLLIYGEGDSRGECERLIGSLNLDDRIKLMGTSTEIPEVLSKAKIFALSSDYEGMPNALMEALAAGVPSIATDCPCGGPGILIEDGVNGLLVPVGDEDKMAGALDVLLSNPKYAERLGAAAAARASGQFGSDVVLEQWREMIEETASNDGL